MPIRDELATVTCPRPVAGAIDSRARRSLTSDQVAEAAVYLRSAG